MVVLVSCVWPASGAVFATYTFDDSDVLEDLMVLLEAEHALPQDRQRLVCGTQAWTVDDAGRRFCDVGLVDPHNGNGVAHRVLVYRRDDGSSRGGGTRTPTPAAAPTDAEAAAARIRQLFGQSSSGPVAAATTAGAVPPPPPPLPLLDMDDAAVQQRLYEAIQRRNIEENLAQAYEHTPEAFAPVTMLYIDCVINGVPVKAFVDSGAQVSLMNIATAERCDLVRLIDRRMRGVAKGMGTQAIVGRVHMTMVRAGAVHLPCSFSVIENNDMDVILGLDQMRRHRMCIDLHDNCLRIADHAIPFLGEADLPAHAKLHTNADEEGDGGDGGGQREGDNEATTSSAQAQQQKLQQQQPAVATEATEAAARPAAATPTPPPQPTLLDEQHEQVLQNFMAATAMDDRAAATAVLEAFAWDADAALSAFLPS